MNHSTSLHTAGLSGPVHRLFPDMTSAQTVLLIIVLEHLMLLLKFLISAAIPDTPHHVAQVSFSQDHFIIVIMIAVSGVGEDGIQKTRGGEADDQSEDG